MGQRLLRTNMLQPLSYLSSGKIQERLDFLEILLKNEEAFYEISEKLPPFPDLEYIVTATLVQVNPFTLMQERW